MSLQIRRADTPDDGWQALARERGSFYHEPAWSALLSREFRFHIEYLTAHDGDLLAGCAVIGSRAGGIPEVVIPEQTGLAFHDGDDIDLAAQIGRLLTDVPLRERLTEEGARRARVTFEPAAAAGRFHALYQDVLADSSR